MSYFVLLTLVACSSPKPGSSSLDDDTGTTDTAETDATSETDTTSSTDTTGETDTTAPAPLWSWGDTVTTTRADGRVRGTSASMSAGAHVVVAGDMNHDGMDDLAIGAAGSRVAAYQGGSVFVLTGRPSGWDELSALEDLPGVHGDTDELQLGQPLAVGDVTGDSLPDLAARPGAGDASSGLGATLFFGLPTGSVPSSTIERRIQYGADADAHVRLLDTMGDLDGDGSPEFLFTDDNWWDGELYVVGAPDATDAQVLPDDGAALLTTPLGETVWSAWPADLDGDGKQDVVVALYDEPDLHVVMGSDLSGSAPVAAAASARIRQAGPEGSWTLLAVVDLDADGADDLVLRHGDDQLAICRGSDSLPAELSPATCAATIDSPGWPVWIGDLNGDDIDDLMLGHGRALEVVLGRATLDGDLSIDAIIDLPGGAGMSTEASRPASTGDMDGDGIDEVVLELYEGGECSLVLLRGRTDWTLGVDLDSPDLRIELDEHCSGSDPVFGDFDGDGLDDLAFGNPGIEEGEWVGGAWIFLGQPAE